MTFLLVAASAILLGAPDARELMRKSEKQHRIAREHTTATMVLQSNSGQREERGYEVFAAQDDAAGDKLLVRFSSPADVKGTALLSVEDPKSKDDEQWLHLPAFRKTRRLGTSELGDRFVGSDFFFEDLKRRYVDDYAYSLLREESLEGQPCWVIESKPSADRVKRDSPYGMSHIWLAKDTSVVLKLRHFDRRLRPLKEITVRELVRVQDAAWRANRVEVVDIVRKHRTTVLVKNRDTGALLSDVFNRHKLDAH